MSRFASMLSSVLPLEFFVRYPWRHYLRNTLPRPRGNLGAFLVGEAECALVAKGVREPGGVSRLEGWHAALPAALGAPSCQSGAPARGAAAQFARSVLGPLRLHADATFVMVVDAGPYYLNLHAVPPGEPATNGDYLERLRESPATIIPTWDAAEPYDWEVLGGNLRPADPAARDEQLIVVGMPRATIENLLSWAEANQGTVAGILPMPLALVGWFRDTFGGYEPLQFLLSRRGAETHLFTLSEGRCVGLKAFKPRDTGTAAQDLEIRRELEAIVWERRPGSNPPLYVWDGAGIAGELAEARDGEPARSDYGWWRNVVELSVERLYARRGLMVSDGAVPLAAYPLEWALRTMGEATPLEA